MTFEQRVEAVTAERFGIAKQRFDQRQARFLVTVMLHAGVCMKRQYLTHCGRAYGQVVHNFFNRLVADGIATPYTAMHRAARVYHVHHKRLYRVIGQPDSRLRKPLPDGRAMERLMVLDAVLARSEVTWLATEQEKLQHFTERLGTGFPREWYPHVAYGQPPSVTRRYFVEHLPIGLADGGREHIFLYLGTSASSSDVRAFIHRHSELWRALPRWQLLVLLPPHLRGALDPYQQACRQELGSPLRPGLVEELQWYFDTTLRPSAAAHTIDRARLQRACRAFRGPRFRELRRAYATHGRRALDAVQSPVLADALSRGTARVSCEALTMPYLYLSSLVGTA
jgi:hypothetical protein